MDESRRLQGPAVRLHHPLLLLADGVEDVHGHLTGDDHLHGGIGIELTDHQGPLVNDAGHRQGDPERVPVQARQGNHAVPSPDIVHQQGDVRYPIPIKIRAGQGDWREARQVGLGVEPPLPVHFKGRAVQHCDLQRTGNHDFLAWQPVQLGKGHVRRRVRQRERSGRLRLLVLEHHDTGSLGRGVTCGVARQKHDLPFPVAIHVACRDDVEGAGLQRPAVLHFAMRKGLAFHAQGAGTERR